MPAQLAKVDRPGPRMLRPWGDALALAALRKEPNGQTRLNRIAEQLVRKAMNGDMSAIREVGERLDGRVNLQLEDLSKDGPVSLQQPLIEQLISALVEKKRAPGDDATVIDGVSTTTTDMVEVKRG